ncbi:MAG TPA: BON domain-containing protein [Steroidobacteraceae bacterium]|nr:BON domain-containing protein [Steroidobacteraceae bacterium]
MNESNREVRRIVSRAGGGASLDGPARATAAGSPAADPWADRRPSPASSEELFGRRPFTYGRWPRYFGTGVPGYASGPGFTGGFFGYGGERPDIPTELEREYAYEVYGEEPGPGWGPAPDSIHGGPPLRPQRRYPPGPKGYTRSDERIREDVCDRLMQSLNIDSSEVTVEVQGGKVLLAGTVPVRSMKHAIEDLADACPGVQDVENRITVSAAPSAGA